MFKGLVALALLSASIVAYAEENRWVTVINNTSGTICKLQASNVNRTSWEEDLLGSKVMAKGVNVNVNIDDGSGNCYFDIKATLCDRRVAIERAVNVCAISRYTIND